MYSPCTITVHLRVFYKLLYSDSINEILDEICVIIASLKLDINTAYVVIF